MWSREYTHTTTASPAEVFRHLSAPGLWHEWNAGVRSVTLEGPFAEGTRAVMTLPDGTELPFVFSRIEEGRGFEDETPVPGTSAVVRVMHLAEALPGGETLLSYRCTVTGDVDAEAAAAVGEAVSADFPEVLAALAARAEGGL